MPEDTQSTPPAQTNGSNTVSPTVPKEGEKPLTRDELLSILSERDTKVDERFNHLAATLRRSKEKVGNTTIDPSSNGNGNGNGKTKTPAEEIAEFRREKQDEISKMTRRVRRLGIREAINTHNLSQDDADLLEAHIEHKYGSSIKADLDQEMPLVFLDRGEIDGPQKISDLIADIMKSSLGGKFKPPKSPPVSKGVRSGNGENLSSIGRTPYDKLSPGERSKMSPDERRQRAFEDAAIAGLQQ